MSRRSPALALGSQVRATSADYRQLLASIIDVYEPRVIRAYSRARFMIININILHMLALCLHGKHRVLDIGCGFGLFGCYFAMLRPDLEYVGVDIDARRIDMARGAADRLGLKNAQFRQQDARELEIDGTFDAVMTIDLLHHINDVAKHRLVQTCVDHLAPDGRMIIKDVTSKPGHQIAFTWALDVLMTRGFDMWYWNEARMAAMLGELFEQTYTFPIADWLPYPHVLYMSEGLRSPRGRE